ncbi:hypothetical protein [Superficieibacter sp. HKU1]|uniref:hypothetical protein n=1 Tax=Superficieibacter sp. HKU1 TaxID=3031919 RepID=UPI0023E18D0A|nr:hypothetical protein [Superficieibacter sp. HKU1]WES66506.1 hypothetical protein P0H77_12550 [Superficieibacter sp. HKU1]
MTINMIVLIDKFIYARKISPDSAVTPTPGGRVVLVGIKVMHWVAPVALLFLRPTKTYK